MHDSIFKTPGRSLLEQNQTQSLVNWILTPVFHALPHISEKTWELGVAL